MKTCLKCGAEMADDAVFCKKCGFADITHCTKCGKKRMPGSQFCRGCGKRFYDPEDQAASAPISGPSPVSESVLAPEPVSPTVAAIEPVWAQEDSPTAPVANKAETGLEPIAPSFGTDTGLMPAPASEGEGPSEYHSFENEGTFTPPAVDASLPTDLSDLTGKKKSPLVPIIVIASLLFIVFAGVAVFFLATASSRRYKQAKKDLDAGNYEKAVAEFEKVGKYEDAEDLLAEARALLHYENGKKAFDQEDFDKALEEFKAAGTINDAEYMAKQSEFAGHYKKGMSLSGSGDYDAAIEEFYKASDYKDAPTQIKACYYKMGQEELSKNNPDGAEKYFNLAEGYQDASSKISEINYVRGENAYKAGDNLSAAKYFYKAGKYQDAEDRANELYYNLAIEAFNKGENEKAAEYFSLIGDYKDSKNYAQSVYYNSGMACLNAKDYENAGKYLYLAGDYQKADQVLTNAIRDLAKANDLINARKLCSFDPAGDKYVDGLTAFYKTDYLTAADHFKASGDFLNSVTLYKSSYYNYGLGIFKTKNYEEAEKYFKLGEDYSYASKLAHVCEGEIKYSQGYISQAATEYSKVSIDKTLKSICKARGFDVSGRKAFVNARLTLERAKGSWNPKANNIEVKFTDKSGYSQRIYSEYIWDGQYLDLSFTYNEKTMRFDITIKLAFGRYSDYSPYDYSQYHEIKSYTKTYKNQKKLPEIIQIDGKTVVLRYVKGVFTVTYTKNVSGSSGVKQFKSVVSYEKATQ